jgi:DNA (cytosine-5)-methyltransferase 1
MTHLELFAGIGGIALASEWAGFEHVGFVERDPFCQKVLAKHWPNVPIYDDVRTFDGTQFRGVDLISGGFPCQPHSLAGSRKASGDERDLWGEVVRIVGEAKPRWFLGENVPGLFSSESGQFFGRIQNDLAEMGYRVGWAMYGASDTGAVHRRNRVFIVAYASSNGLQRPAEVGELEGGRLSLDDQRPGRTDGGANATDASRVSNGKADIPVGTIGSGREPRNYVGWGDSVANLIICLYNVKDKL